MFKDAMKFQAKHFKSSYVAVVVLDEVGLAEDSPNLPLKALHPLLEDGTEGASSDRDFSDKVKCTLGHVEVVSLPSLKPWHIVIVHLGCPFG